MKTNLFTENMNCLKNYHPEIAKKIEKTTINRQFKLLYKNNAPPNLFSLEKAKPYYHPYRPLENCIEELNNLHLKNTQIALFLGFGLGYELMLYKQHFSSSQKTSHICVIEKNPEIMKQSMMTINLIPFFTDKTITFFLEERLEGLFPKFVDYFGEKQRFVLINAINPVYTKSALDLYGDYYLKCSELFKKAAHNKISDYGNSPMDSLVGIENMLSNLDVIIENPGIINLKDKFTDKPGVVVSTGPSLDKNIDLLKGIEDKAVVVAPEASLKPLLNAGIKPHILTSLERTIPIVELVRDFKKEDVKDIYLGACPVVDREVFQQYNGPKLIVYRAFDHFKWLNLDKGMLDIKISAGNMAFKVCEYMGCNPIILVGQDLAHADDGKTHASGFVFKDDPNKHFDLLKVKGNIQEEVYTTKTWLTALNAYIRDLATYNGLCINSTEGGAYIQGTTVMPLQKALKQYVQNTEKQHPLNTIQKSLKNFRTSENKKVTKQKIIKLIEKTKEDLKFIIKQYEKIIEIIQTYLDDDNTNKKNNQKIMKKNINTIKADIIKNRFNTFQYFLAHILQSVIIHNVIRNNSVANHFSTEQEIESAKLSNDLQYHKIGIQIIKKTFESLEKSENLLKNGTWKRSQNNLRFHKMSMKPEEYNHYFHNDDN